jgi:transglutaminase-like putative cysteine protease
MRVLTLLLLLVNAWLPISGGQDDVARTLARARAFEEAGKFREARSLLQDALSNHPGSDALSREIEQLRRIRLDYRLTREALASRLMKALKDLREEELEMWIAEGRFDARVIDDTLRFMNSSVRNLFWRYPEIMVRQVKPEERTFFWRRALALTDSITAASRRSKTPYVLPRRMRGRAELAVDPGAVPAGETIRAWLPVPRLYPYQTMERIVGSSSPLVSLDSGSSPIRSACLEQKAAAGAPTAFFVEFEYTRWGVHFELDTARVMSVDPTDPALAPYLQEGPHVRFTPGVRELSRRIVGAETNPLKAARALYLWVVENLHYSHAREYSTLENITEYVLERRYGDCGQHALFFMTLCRLNGIPARWQSGWDTTPDDEIIHDWAEVYLAPYGWIPVDPDAGVLATRYYVTLTLEERRRLRDFYFGGLEHHRMAANGDHCQELRPAKRHPRSDDVDFQRGEAEWKGGNLYFDAFDSGFRITEIPPPRAGGS